MGCFENISLRIYPSNGSIWLHTCIAAYVPVHSGRWQQQLQCCVAVAVMQWSGYAAALSYMNAVTYLAWACAWMTCRLKQVELPQLNAVVDVPKTIALANIALRVQRRLADEFFERCGCHTRWMHASETFAVHAL